MLPGLNPMSMEEALPRLRRNSPAVVEEHERERDLHHHQDIAHARTAMRSESHGAILQRADQVRPRSAQRRNQPEQQSRDQDKPRVNSATRQSTLKSKAIGNGSGS